jgi:hypothetical protein
MSREALPQDTGLSEVPQAKREDDPSARPKLPSTEVMKRPEDHVPRLERARLPAKCEKVNFKNRIFQDVNAKKVEFTNCDFSYCYFDRAYFRDAVFRNCEFIGARITNSNFKGARFFQCDFKYAEFSNCIVDPREVVVNLPYEPNIRSAVLRNLRANCAAIGDYKNQGFLALQEIEADRDHHYKSLVGANSYYKEKYPSALDKMNALSHLGTYYVSKFLWGHGEKPKNILLSMLAFILVCSLINFWGVMPRVGWISTEGGLNVLKYVFELFLDMTPDKTFSGFKFIDYATVIGRYVYIGLFVSVLLKRISHR